MVRLERGDIFLSKSHSWLGRGIRWATRESGESATEANHVGCILTSGDIRDVDCVEALKEVKYHNFWDQYGNTNTAVAVFRPSFLTQDQRNQATNYLINSVGRTYGYAKIFLHLLRRWSGPRQVIDWLSPLALDNYPICSYLVARAYEEAGVDFGVPSRLATPDDIWDYCVDNPRLYRQVLPLGVLRG